MIVMPLWIWAALMVVCLLGMFRGLVTYPDDAELVLALGGAPWLVARLIWHEQLLLTAAWSGLWLLLWLRKRRRDLLSRVTGLVREVADRSGLRVVPVRDRGDTPPRVLLLVAGIVLVVVIVIWLISLVVS